MAADIALRVGLLNVEADMTSGFLVPLNSFYFGAYGANGLGNINHREIRKGFLFVFDETTSTVSKRAVDIIGIRENMAIVNQGVTEGDIIAAAGVSYLYDGQQVKLLPLTDKQ